LNLQTQDAVTSWTLIWDAATSPPNTGSVEVNCQSNGAKPAWLDQFYLNTVNNY
jgi:hypothetical protein